MNEKQERLDELVMKLIENSGSLSDSEQAELYELSKTYKYLGTFS